MSSPPASRAEQETWPHVVSGYQINKFPLVGIVSWKEPVREFTAFALPENLLNICSSLISSRLTLRLKLRSAFLVFVSSDQQLNLSVLSERDWSWLLAELQRKLGAWFA